MVDALEADILLALDSASQTVEAASAVVNAAGGELAQLDTGIMELAASARAAASQTFRIANSSDELAAASGEMTGVIDGATQKARDAVSSARAANGLVADLAKAAEDIAAIVDTIASVARQTNLLALTATIEAARAGDAGNGFANVARDVKNLSVETSKAARDIRARIDRLGQSAGSSIRSVEKAVSIIQEVQPALATVRGAVVGQTASLRDASQRATEAAVAVIAVSRKAEQIHAASRAATRRVGQGGEARAEAEATARSAAERFVTIVRQNEAADRRRHDRYPANFPVTLQVGAHSLATHTIDISAGGVLLANLHEVALSPGYSVHIDVDGIGLLPARVAAVSAIGLHCAFAELEAEAEARLARVLAELGEEYLPLILVAQQAGRRIEGALEQAITDGRITPEQLFDTAYRPIPGTNPRQYEAAFTGVLEDLLPEIQEPLLLSDNRMSFCVAIDGNGYTPVHNRKHSLPQRPGDIAWNAINSCNKRLCDDRPALVAARSVRPFVLQGYARDMGGGRMVMTREIAVPLRVLGRHWGGFRTAYQF